MMRIHTSSILDSLTQLSGMPVMPSRGRRIRDAFFTRESPNGDDWVCKCGKKRKNTGTGYTNLVSHVQSQHPDDLQAVLSDMRESAVSSSVPSNFFYSKKTIQIHGWIDLVVNALQPFYSVENKVFQRVVRFESITYKTLSKYMSLLTQSVESKIARGLPDRFALVLDGWTA